MEIAGYRLPVTSLRLTSSLQSRARREGLCKLPGVNLTFPPVDPVVFERMGTQFLKVPSHLHGRFGYLGDVRVLEA